MTTRASAKARSHIMAAPELELDDRGWAEATAEAVDHLQRCLRVNTVNPPGNEMALAPSR